MKMARVLFESEKELEDYIYTELGAMINPINGEKIDWYGRQVDLGSYGVIDLMTVRFLPEAREIYVIEVKKEVITPKAFAQISKYIIGILHYFDRYAPDMEVLVQGILVSPSVDASEDTLFLINQVNFIEAYSMEFDLKKGVRFNIRPSYRRYNPDFSKFNAIYGLEMIANGTHIQNVNKEGEDSSTYEDPEIQ
jgi:RecB family endonuclease NucS